MAGRPPKEGIDYSGWAVDIFDNDPKIDKLLDSQGAAGFLVYFYLCQRAYGSKGYYFSWSYDDAATTARKIGGGVGSETVKQAVGLCLQIGLFDKRLFDRDGILTSRGIQKRFWQVAKDRTCNTVNDDYWLLEKAGSLINHTQKANYTGSKLNYAAPKLNYAERKESKGKKSKKREIEPPTRADVELFCRERNSPVDPGRFYDYFTADTENPWHDRDGRPVTNWRQKLIGWEQNEKNVPGKQIPPEDDVLQNTYFNPLFSDKKGG